MLLQLFVINYFDKLIFLFFFLTLVSKYPLKLSTFKVGNFFYFETFFQNCFDSMTFIECIYIHLRKSFSKGHFWLLVWGTRMGPSSSSRVNTCPLWPILKTEALDFDAGLEKNPLGMVSSRPIRSSGPGTSSYWSFKSRPICNYMIMYFILEPTYLSHYL